jgi:hypothetical protein
MCESPARALTQPAPSQDAAVWQAPGFVAQALDSDLFDRLRDVLARGGTTEAELRDLTDETGGLVRVLRAQVRASERRIRTLERDPASPISEIADELRRVETLRPRLREARDLRGRLDERARELRTEWLLRQTETTRPRPAD